MTLSGGNFSIRGTGIILIGVPIAFQLAALAFLLKVQNDARIAQQWELHSKEVISRIAELRTTLDNGHAAVRGASIYETLDFERERREAIVTWPAMLLALRQLVSDNPAQQAQLDGVRDASAPYLEWVQGMEALGREGRWSDFEAELRTARGKTLVEAVDVALSNFSREEERLDGVRVERLATSQRNEQMALLGIAVLAVAVAVGMLLFFTGGISRRIARIALNGERLASGEPLQAPLTGRDELASLDAVLHDSANRLVAAAAVERRYAAELEARGRALEQSNKDLLFKTQENEMFVYSVSHDLRSPLVNVQGFTKELTRGCDDLRRTIAAAGVSAADRERLERIVESDIAESIGFIQAAVTRLSGIVDALLRLSRAGRVEFRRQRVELQPVVDRVVRAMRGTMEERQATITVDPLPAVTGDPAAIEQVFANLIGNALNYLDPKRPGQVHVGVGAPDRRPETRADGAPPKAASDVVVFVRDNGLGIPARYFSKLFVPFERLHGNQVKGEGIGLALSKRLVERQSGRIWAESVEKQETTFYVTLPAAQPLPGAEAAAAVTS